MDYACWAFIRKHTPEEEKEFRSMERALQTLLKNGILTEIEYRIIAPIRQLAARKTLLYNIMVSKYQNDPMGVLEMFKILTSRIKKQEDEKLPNLEAGEENRANPLNATGKNPLLIDTIIHNVFQFLPLNEIKKCRLVNNQWNATAEPFLRKRGVIHFTPGTLKPSAFIEYSKYSLPDLPFTHFKFSNKCSGAKTWSSPEIREFLDSWGHNIKSTEFSQIHLNRNALGNVSSWLEKAKNLTKLIINCDRHTRSSRNPTTLQVDLDKLRMVDSISLSNCDIMIPDNGINLRIAPREIALDCVDFHKEGHSINNEICLTDYIDFRPALKIDIRNCIPGMSFDMSSVCLNANSIHFDGIEVKNREGATGKVHSLSLANLNLTKINTLEIKELTFKSGTISLSVIPPTIEKINISDSDESKIIYDHRLQLPNLKFLRLCQWCYDSLEVMSRFSRCTGLVAVELGVSRSLTALCIEVGMIPSSVKKLKINNIILFANGRNKLQLDTLIREGSNFETFFTDVTKMLRNKTLELNVLVLSCLKPIGNETFDDIIDFIKAHMMKNKRFGKLVIGVRGKKMNLSSGTDLSRYADKESNYYQFTNTVGESITREEFLAYANIDGQ